MDARKHLFLSLSIFLFLLISGQSLLLLAEARVQHQQHNHQPRKLFVFGDSYVDTGNNDKKDPTSAWRDPYGISFPGKPTGRFSDGRVLTDYIAKYLEGKSPVPYTLRKLMPQHLKYGINFAYGGTGVFDTWITAPNMTTQIDFFQQLINDKVYSNTDLAKSVALISIAGNDYTQYLITNGSVQGFPSFIASVVNQAISNIIRIHRLGVKKIAVGGLAPLGCIPASTVSSSFHQCNNSSDNLLALHNRLLRKGVAKLDKNHKNHTAFVMLDLFDCFMSVLNRPLTHNIQNHFKPCCVGVSSEFKCGDVDENNVRKYKVCDVPKSSFFWDMWHPTQAGWHAVYDKLRTTNALQKLQH